MRSETQEIETRAAEWIYWKTPTFICCRLNMLRPPPPSHAGMSMIPCLSLSISSLCILPVHADGPKKTTTKSVGLFQYIPSTRVVIGEVSLSHGDVHSMHSPHSPDPDRTLCFCPPVPIVLMPNLQMDLVCKVALIVDVFSYVQKPNSRSYNVVEVSGHNLESSQTWGFRVHCLQYKQFQYVSRGDCEQQGGKLLRLLSQLLPRIRPL